MRLSRKIDQALGIIIAVSIAVVFGVICNSMARDTSAVGDVTPNTFVAEGAKYVTFYDNGNIIIVLR